MELAIVIYGAVWVVVVSAANGIRAVDLRLKDVVSTLQLSRISALQKVILASAFRPIMVGLRLALGISLVLAVVSEMIGNPEGLGYQLTTQLSGLQTSPLFVYIISIGLLGIVLNALFVWSVKHLAPGFEAIGKHGKQ